MKDAVKVVKNINMLQFEGTPKVSIIVPVYNTEKYLSKCLNSLINQTLKEIEIVIVNDGSTDNSAVIISEFKEHDSRIKVITQENKLQGAARNNGTKIATGEYIGFVDSDDWVDLDYFEKLYTAAKKYDSDIALATNVRIGNGKTKKRLNITEENVVTSLQDKIDICQQWRNECPTNKIYRRLLLTSNNIFWPEGCYCEDKLFTIQAIYYANGIVSVPGINYYYYRNPSSTVNKKTAKHFNIVTDDKNKAKRNVLRFLKEKDCDIRDKDFWAINQEFRLFGVALWKKIESLYTKETRLLGFPLLSIEDTAEYRIQRFIGGLIFTKKIKSNTKEHKLFKFLGLPISERVTEDDICKYYCCGILVRQFHLSKSLFQKCLKKVNFEYDDVYLLHSNSGEMYLFFAYLASSFLTKNNSKKPLFIATKKYHIDILKLYFPDAQYIYNKKLRFTTQSNHWTLNGHNVYILFSSNHFQQVEIDIKQNDVGKIHYLERILSTLGLTINDYRKPQPIITKETQDSLINKVNEMRLNLNNFIIISPEALTCEELTSNFWGNLIKRLQEQGYDLFVNITNKYEYNFKECKSMMLNYQEILALAGKAKAIISLRSGLTEFLLPTSTPSVTIYTKFRNRRVRNAFSVEKTIAGFSMLKMPYTTKDKIVEINSDEFLNEGALLENVLDSLKSILKKEEALV